VISDRPIKELTMQLTTAPSATPAIDHTAIKARQRVAWSTGDFAVIGTTLQIVGESLCEAVDLRSGERVLDVACGNGNAALAAARRFAQVTGVDFVPALLDRARARAEADGLALDLREADAEELPFPDGSFDVVLSTFGCMFTPDQLRAARELARVCRPGGRIGLANWTPDGFIGQLFKVLGRYVPPAPGLSSPALWGTEARLEEMFGQSSSQITVARRDFVFRYLSAEHWLQVFRTYYGPVNRAFAALDVEKQAALEADITALLHRFNRAGAASLVLPAEYLEVVIRR
jgi:ubiquinone/menaquinone biosynthesis C-methylase UbiE